ncbi:glycerol uptake facilitator protein [Leptospira ryugenii]|uniref:Glycerol uptake facilitator protein n=1 Tax=Leptospira ryugenii TaxID=1917863 RepID=A0A2P2E2S8_9LEPT|nr:MIP/aquaporin family protein [Leptospira ryugenii]GBF51202.1 glycerol uptake facilitator protein [Leptospira ryugenii]
MWQTCLGEFLGTCVLIYFGNGVVAGALLERSKAKASGWISITTGWALGVVFGILTAKTFGSSGAHLNPAVTLSVCLQNGDFTKLIPYSISQILGASFGSFLVYLHHLPHWKETKDSGLILAIHSTDPAIDHPIGNFLSEMLGTLMLIFGIHVIFHAYHEPLNGMLGVLMVGALVWAIGLSMGGTTGYAINPARDLGPRLLHTILPIPNKGPSNWKYSWIPILAPLCGASLAVVLLKLLPVL